MNNNYIDWGRDVADLYKTKIHYNIIYEDISLKILIIHCLDNLCNV